MNLPKYDRYKDSGVEWLGAIPEKWKLKRLKFLVKIKTGEKDVINKVDNGQYPFFIRSPKVQRIDTYSYDEEAVLTAGDGDIGKIFHYINGKFEYHQRVYKFSHFREIKGKFLYYYLHRNLAEEVVKLSAKSTVDSLRLPMLQNFPVCIPPIAEQKRIAEFLDCKCGEIGEAISKMKRLIELLEEQKTILINQAVTKGLNPNAPMKDSGIEWLGEIPGHWDFKKAKHLFQQSRLPVRKDDGVVTCYRDGEVTLRTNRRTEGYTIAVLEQGYQGIREGQLVINSMDAFAGSIGVSDSNGKCSPEYVVCDPQNKKEALPDYYALLLREMALSGFIEIICPAVRQRGKRMRYSNFAPLLLPIPPFDEQLEIIIYIESIAKEIKAFTLKIHYQIEKLTELKQILIAEAVTGKIKV